MWVLSSFTAVFVCLLQSVQADRVVMTTNGPLQGITVESEGRFLEAYLGIPYAEPPIGRLRFARPVPKTPWSGVYDASRMAPVCIQNATMQFYYAPNIENMTEDCLYLNIWVSNSIKRGSRLKPVLFYIHGGAFNIGSSNMEVQNGAKLAAFGDVVVVTINYRVGVLGFFSASLPEAGGNMGLYDQVVALRWVRDNAASFGGDPDHIVLVGQSAGAMSAAGHMLSPIARHMVKRVILQSGAAMLPMILDNSSLARASQSMANMVGCADSTFTLKDNPRMIVNCLKRLPAVELSRAEGILMSANPITFTPSAGDEYMPKNTIQAIRDGDFLDTEMLVGVDKDEGTFFITAAIPQYFGVYGINPVKTVSKRLAYQFTRLIYKSLGEPGEGNIASYYVNSVENGTSEKYTVAMSESIGDFMINCNTVFHSEFHSMRNNPVYYYKFSHRPSDSPLAEWMGTTHFDEMEFVFGNPLHGNFTEEEEVLSRRMMSRWIAFAKTGNPNADDAIEWPKYNYTHPLYLDIDVEETVQNRPDNYRCEFWRERYQAVIDDEVVSRLQNSHLALHRYSSSSGSFIAPTLTSLIVALLLLISVL